MNTLPATLLTPVLDAASEPLLIAERSGLVIVAGNGAATGFTGYSRDKLSRILLSEILEPEDPLTFSGMLKEADGPDTWVGGAMLQRAGGGRVLVSIKLRRIREEGDRWITVALRNLAAESQVPVYRPEQKFPIMDLLVNAPVCVAVFSGPEHIIRSTNQFNLLLTGLRHIVGKMARDVFPDADYPGFLHMLDQVYWSGMPYASYETFVPLGQSSPTFGDRYMNLLYQPYRNSTGDIEGVLFFGMDVSEQVKARKRIEESERSYRRIVETAQEGIWTIDEHCVVNFVNRKMCEILECEPSDIIGRPLFDFMAESEQALARTMIDNHTSLADASRDFEFVTGKGRPIWVNVSANPIYGANQQYQGALAMITDITERREAALRIQRNEERFRSLIENSEDVIVMADGNWNLLYESPSMERMTGFTTEERRSIGSLNLVHPDDREEMEGVMREVRRSPGVHFPWKHRKLHKDGHYIWIEGTIVNKLDDVNVQAIYSNQRDITERKRAEEELLQKNDQLRSLSAHLQNVREEERGEIAREIHDELGQLLTGLKMEASWLYKKLQPEGDVLSNRFGGFLHMIDDMINTVRRISTDLRPAILDDFGLAEALAWQASEFEKRTGIRCQVTSDLSGDIEDRHIALTMFRVFQETLTNVARHASAGEVMAHIGNDASCLSLIITDDGIGISEDSVNHSRTVGILGMRERISMVNGRFSIAKNGPGGTITTVSVPYRMPIENQESHA